MVYNIYEKDWDSDIMLQRRVSIGDNKYKRVPITTSGNSEEEAMKNFMDRYGIVSLSDIDNIYLVEYKEDNPTIIHTGCDFDSWIEAHPYRPIEL